MEICPKKGIVHRCRSQLGLDPMGRKAARRKQVSRSVWMMDVGPPGPCSRRVIADDLLDDSSVESRPTISVSRSLSPDMLYFSINVISDQVTSSEILATVTSCPIDKRRLGAEDDKAVAVLARRGF